MLIHTKWLLKVDINAPKEKYKMPYKSPPGQDKELH